MPNVLELRNVGPIGHAEVHFGDLTVLVGPQATGKSILLEFLKLVLDRPSIFRTLRKYGFEWERGWDDFSTLYFGEGTNRIWRPSHSRIGWQGRDINPVEFIRRNGARGLSRHSEPGPEQCFFIPAQRVLALSREGWLRPFDNYKLGDPYVLRDFSEKLRLEMEGIGRASLVFPQERRLRPEIRGLVETTMFPSFRLKVERQGPQRRLLLDDGNSKSASGGLPFMVWSAGQREFVPLLLGLYWVMPPKQTTVSRHLKWVIIEEPEMGLHPKAISVILLIVLDLLSRGYKVCLSTHSSHILDLVWALNVFRQHRAKASRVLDLFDSPQTAAMTKVADAALKKELRVFYFDPASSRTSDISTLDPGSDRAAEAGWGGLTDFSGRVADQVARVVAEHR